MLGKERFTPEQSGDLTEVGRKDGFPLEYFQQRKGALARIIFLLLSFWNPNPNPVDVAITFAIITV